jgi:hypothetical protein
VSHRGIVKTLGALQEIRLARQPKMRLMFVGIHAFFTMRRYTIMDLRDPSPRVDIRFTRKKM